MKTAPLRIALAFAFVAALAPAAVATERREIDESFEYSAGQRVVIEFPVGSLRVEAAKVGSVRVEIEARCRWASSRCEDRLAELEVESRASARRLRIDVDADGPWSNSRLEIEGVITVPRGAPLEIEMGVGELAVEGFENDVRIDMGVGEVRVRMAESAVGRVSLDTGIGEAGLLGPRGRVRERRPMLIGSEVLWDDGEGEADVDVDLGVGEISVYLD